MLEEGHLEPSRYVLAPLAMLMNIPSFSYKAKWFQSSTICFTLKRSSLGNSNSTIGFPAIVEITRSLRVIIPPRGKYNQECGDRKRTRQLATHVIEP